MRRRASAAAGTPCILSAGRVAAASAVSPLKDPLGPRDEEGAPRSEKDVEGGEMERRYPHGARGRDHPQEKRYAVLEFRPFCATGDFNRRISRSATVPAARILR